MNRGQGDKSRRTWLRIRLRAVALVFLAVFVILVGRSVHLQVFKQDALESKARGEFMRRHQIAPRRGIIYDRNQVELAVSLDTDSVYASPAAVTTPRGHGRKLARALGQDRRKLSAKLKGKRHFTWIARRVTPRKAQAVRALNLKGVGLLKEPRRFYPYSELACHVLGFAGFDATGLSGLELSFDKTLKGSVLTVHSMRDALGRTIHLTQQRMATLPEGDHLILTLDKGLQYKTQKILAATVKKFRAQAGQAIVMVPSTGEILAMASWPVFNPNLYWRYPEGAYRNRNVTDPFEPGSTFKIFVAAAALRSGRITLEELFDCENGRWEVGGRTIHDTHRHGRLDLADIVKFSSNIGAAKVGIKVGAQELYSVLRDFGFGQFTGVELPGESRGILRPAQKWRPVELANICFGQGVAVTPLQLLQAVSAVANGGMMMRPYLVRARISREARLLEETQPQAARRVLGVRSARILAKMMTRVTEEGGTGTRARLDAFSVAGKTGTAQKVVHGGGYSKTDYIASFVGFAPAGDPKVAVLVVIDTPHKEHYGGVVAAPAFASITREALACLGYTAPPSETTLVKAPGSKPAPKAKAPDRPKVPPQEALAAGLAPDVRGMTLRQVLALGGRSGLAVRASGWGRVVSQKPAPGKKLGKQLRVRLSPDWGGAG